MLWITLDRREDFGVERLHRVLDDLDRISLVFHAERIPVRPRETGTNKPALLFAESVRLTRLRGVLYVRQQIRQMLLTQP